MNACRILPGAAECRRNQNLSQDEKQRKAGLAGRASVIWGRCGAPASRSRSPSFTPSPAGLQEPRAERLYGILNYKMPIWDIPDTTYLLKGGCAVCVVKRTFSRQRSDLELSASAVLARPGQCSCPSTHDVGGCFSCSNFPGHDVYYGMSTGLRWRSRTRICPDEQPDGRYRQAAWSMGGGTPHGSGQGSCRTGTG